MTNKKGVPWLPADSWGTLKQNELNHFSNSAPKSQCLIKIDRVVARLEPMIKEHIRREEAKS